jgi:prophage tail gpP-like protein
MIKPGSQYTTKAGDTYKTVAAEAYGDGALWTLVSDANLETKSDPTSLDYLAIAPGETIIIPELAGLKRSKIKTDILKIKYVPPVKADYSRNLMTLNIEGRSVKIISGRVHAAIDAMADAWTIETPWTPGEDPTLDASTKPFSYAESEIYVGDTLVGTGLLFDVGVRYDQGRTKILKCFSYAKNAVDSNVREPYEYNSYTLDEILAALTQDLNINIYAQVETGGTFDRVTAAAGQTIFSFVAKLAAQRGVLVTSTPTGDLAILKPASTGTVGVLEEGKTNLVTSWSADFSGQDRFHMYVSLGQSAGWGQKQSPVTDPGVPKSRYKTYTFDETTEGNIEISAEWRKSKAVADALTIRLPVSSWYAPDGELWTKNTIVTVVSETLFVPNGFDFLIKAVEYSTDDRGNTCALHLVPPQVYTKEKIIEPWRSQ